MVSFWPFGGENTNSAKSFEKALVALSDKIQRLQIRDDTLRATHRRVKVLFTLYGIFAYILVSVILTLIIGYQKWRAAEWTAIAASPIGIVAVRYLLDGYFDWREGNVRTRLDKKVKERDAVIKQLKDATKYDSTKELLDKYGGVEKRNAQQSAKKKSEKPQQVQRTGLPPPPTANIPGRVPPPANAIDARLRSVSAGQGLASTGHSRNPSLASTQAGESFAPNAFDFVPVPQQQYRDPGTVPAPRPGFLDRVLDLLVGEDENAARNRIVLLCTSCRTVNGQAPPGTRSLADIGRWKCYKCEAWNGEDSEASKALKAAERLSDEVASKKEVLRDTADTRKSGSEDVDDADEPSDEHDTANTTSLSQTPSASTRSRKRTSQIE